MNEQTFELVKLIIELIMTALAIYVVPAVKAWIQNNQIDKKATALVAAAYQIMSDDPQYNDEKKAYAVKGIMEFAKTLGKELTEEQAITLIESAYVIFKKEVLKK